MDNDFEPRKDERLTAEEFIRANTALKSPSLVAELKLHLADEALPLWQKTEEELSQDGLSPPFWAFAWAGGQALARYVLDNPFVVAGRRVLELGAGGGIAAIAAARAGARPVAANDIDPFAVAAASLNAAANGVEVELSCADILDGAPAAEVLLIGDLFYEQPLADRALAMAQRMASAGSDVFVGDPSRTFMPKDALVPLKTYAVPTPRELEDADVKRTTVWRLR
ncbi:MAG: 50S ribosomal protein L11 methyltransferase [Pseudomonadota bacterium]